MIPDLRSSWELGGETDWENAANDWVDGKI